MHEDIRRFSISGRTSANDFVKSKERLEHYLETMMRDEGFVPVVELNTQCTREYNEGDSTFDFVLSVYGANVGVEKSCKNTAITNGTLIPVVSTPQTK